MHNFRTMVDAELTRLRRKHDIGNFHEGWALIYEEVDELWEEVRKKNGHRSRKNSLRELVQIAALAQRMAEDLNLLG